MNGLLELKLQKNDRSKLELTDERSKKKNETGKLENAYKRSDKA